MRVIRGSGRGFWSGVGVPVAGRGSDVGFEGLDGAVVAALEQLALVNPGLRQLRHPQKPNRVRALPSATARGGSRGPYDAVEDWGAFVAFGAYS